MLDRWVSATWKQKKQSTVMICCHFLHVNCFLHIYFLTQRGLDEITDFGVAQCWIQFMNDGKQSGKKGVRCCCPVPQAATPLHMLLRLKWDPICILWLLLVWNLDLSKWHLMFTIYTGYLQNDSQIITTSRDPLKLSVNWKVPNRWILESQKSGKKSG